MLTYVLGTVCMTSSDLTATLHGKNNCPFCRPEEVRQLAQVTVKWPRLDLNFSLFPEPESLPVPWGPEQALEALKMAGPFSQIFDGWGPTIQSLLS